MSIDHRNHRFVPAVAPRPRTQTELSTRNRTLSFSDAFIAVEWLNATRGSAAYRRVFDLYGELEQLGTALGSIRQQRRENRARVVAQKRPPSESDVAAAVQRAEIYRQFRERHNALNKLFSRYTFVPVMAYDLDSGVWRFNTISKGSRGRTVPVSDGQLTVQVDETSVVAALARLAANRDLYKVRLCPMCEARWRVSERAMDKFCSAECRAKFRMTNEDSRDRHARQQREYRDRLKDYEGRE